MPERPDPPQPTGLRNSNPSAQKAQQSERRSQVRALLLLALAAILFAILRAGVHGVFTPGWWRLW
jgi:nitrate reductase NapE component